MNGGATMYIEKKKKGYKFSEKYRGRDDKWHTKSITLESNNARTRVEAQRILDQKIEEDLFVVEHIRLSKLVDTYCNRSSATERSVINYRSTFRGIIKLLGDPIISEIRISYLIERLERVSNNPNTYNRYVHLLKMVFTWAYKREYLNTDIARRLECIRSKPTKCITDKYMEPEELHSVLKIMSEKYPYEYYICRFMVLTGTRVGEVFALKMNDISENYIRIDETYDWRRKSFDDPKGAIRDIYIQDELRQFLKQLNIVRNERLMQYGIRNTNLLFFRTNGEPYIYNSFKEHVKIISSEAIGKKITPHAFRHTHVSILVAEGVSLEAISRRVGHTDTKITKEIYLHVTEKMKEKDNAEIKEIRIG